MQRSGNTVLALGVRFVVLLGLVARAAGVYLRMALDSRGIWRAGPERLVASQQAFARRFVAVAVRYKGALIKLGQVASLRVDVLPETVSDELARLQDRVEPHPVDEIEEQLRAELGASSDAWFERFEPEPVASASLGQVHEAWLEGGRRVAVKVLYPGVERSVAVDLAAARIGLWLFDFVTVADLDPVYRQVRDSLLREMDYCAEGRAAEEVARNLAGDPEVARRVRVPSIHWPLTRERVLTMEFIDGCKINDRAGLEAQGVDVDEIVTWATRAFLHMIFRDGFFHCDPHPGNLVVDPEGRIGILDFGMNQRLEPAVMQMMRENLLATVQRDPERYARSLLDADMIDERDFDTVRELAELMFDPEYYNLTPAEMANLDFGEYFQRTRVHLKKVRSFRLPDGVVMWSRAITLLMGLATELAPGIRPLEVVGPYVMTFLAGGGAMGGASGPPGGSAAGGGAGGEAAPVGDASSASIP